jgi:ubiquinone/menaquinone biosynthesis C-methylase UbiE
MKPAASEFYEKEAGAYDDKRFSTLTGRLVDSLQKKAVRGLCSFSPGEVLLDVGTGTGRFALDLAEQAAWVVGIDCSVAMIQEAKRKSASWKLSHRISLAIADGHALPFRKDCVQWCVSVNVLLHIQDYEVVLRQMAQMLGNDGGLVTNFPILQRAYFPVAVVVNLRKRALFEHVYSRWFTLGEVRQSLARAGFRVENTIGLLLVTKQIRSRFAEVWLAHFMSRMDRIFSRSFLKYLSGLLFIRSRKL